MLEFDYRTQLAMRDSMLHTVFVVILPPANPYASAQAGALDTLAAARSELHRCARAERHRNRHYLAPHWAGNHYQEKAP